MLGFVFVADFFTLYHGIHHHPSPPFGRIFLEKMCEKIEDLGEILSGTADQMEDTSFFTKMEEGSSSKCSMGLPYISYIWLQFMVNVGKDSISGALGSCCFFPYPTEQ